ncbi:MAG: hypothetical protein KHZ58_15615 [Hungatella hathewayi]|nr:hypothetical protein [Hungatella hathewayi]
MQEHNQRNKSRQRYRLHRNRILLVMGCLLVTAAAAGGIAVFRFPAPVQAWMDIQPDRHAVSGSLHSRESREIDKDNFWVVLNQLPTIPEGSRECNIEYENPDSNHYSARVSLYLTESGQLLGSTRRVDPGNYVEVIQMNQTLEAGEYPLTVRIELFEETTPSGTMTLEMTLRITKP